MLLMAGVTGNFRMMALIAFYMIGMDLYGLEHLREFAK